MGQRSRRSAISPLLLPGTVLYSFCEPTSFLLTPLRLPLRAVVNSSSQRHGRGRSWPCTPALMLAQEDNCLHAWHSSDNQNSLLARLPTKSTRSKTETADKVSEPAAPVPGIHCWAPPTRQSQATGTRHADACAMSRLQSLHSLLPTANFTKPICMLGWSPLHPQTSSELPSLLRWGLQGHSWAARVHCIFGELLWSTQQCWAPSSRADRHRALQMRHIPSPCVALGQHGRKLLFSKTTSENLQAFAVTKNHIPNLPELISTCWPATAITFSFPNCSCPLEKGPC